MVPVSGRQRFLVNEHLYHLLEFIQIPALPDTLFVTFLELY